MTAVRMWSGRMWGWGREQGTSLLGVWGPGEVAVVGWGWSVASMTMQQSGQAQGWSLVGGL